MTGSCSEEIRLWNLGGKKLPNRATKQLRAAEYTLVVALAISADGTYIAAGTLERVTGTAVRVCEAKTGEWKLVCEREREREHHERRDLVFHPSRPVVTHRGGPGEVVFYDAASQTELKRYAWPLEKITAITFASDGLRCAAVGTGKVVIWDVDV
jgi:hypothetical protein